MTSKPIETLDDFRAACEDHDLTYSYSDDPRWYHAGYDQRRRIDDAAKNFPREDVERIWNGVVDTKLIESARSMFYWRWPDAQKP